MPYVCVYHPNHPLVGIVCVCAFVCEFRVLFFPFVLSFLFTTVESLCYCEAEDNG